LIYKFLLLHVIQFFDFKSNGDYQDYITQEDNQDFNYFSGDGTIDQFSASLANEYIPCA